MECSHAYTRRNDRYIYCDFEGTPVGRTLDEITPYLCIYQPFPPPSFKPVDMLLPTWTECVKLQEERNNKKYVLVSDWQADNTYLDFPYRVRIPVSGATTDMFPYVEFEQQEQESGNFADVSATYNGGVYIYARTIPDHNFWVAVNIYQETE